jgi:hypothetical protein
VSRLRAEPRTPASTVEQADALLASSRDEPRLARSLATEGQASAALALQAGRIANALGTMVRSVGMAA